MSGPIFLIALVVVLGPCHWYLWRRLIKDPIRNSRVRQVLTIVLGLLAASLLVAFSRRVRDLLGVEGVASTIVGYMWLGVLLYAVLTLLVLEIPRAVAKCALARRVEPDESRRLLIARGTAIFAGLTAASITGYGVKTALGPPVLKRLQIPLSRLPRGFDGYQIMVVSDIHMNSLTDPDRTRRLVSSINAANPDLIAIVGDLVDGRVEALLEQALPLRGLSSRDGVFFVTGNHEYYSGVTEWLDELPGLGLRPLRNERLDIRGLDLAGVDDVSAAPDYAKALGDRDPAKPVILLAHQPVAVHEAAKYNVDLQLSGHTHGGQMVPFNLVVGMAQPVVSGLAEVDGTKVYVTNGAGFWGPPIRVGAPPDITLVELRVI